MSRAWILDSQEGFEASLKFKEGVPIPGQADLPANGALVKLFAASLNYRELMIADPTSPIGPINTPLIPGCDGAGVVLAVGSSVRDFRVGDKVITYPAPAVPEAQDGDDSAAPGLPDASLMLGQGIDGTLRSVGVFTEKALVHAPASLGWTLAASLPCNWATAWNVLFGLGGKKAGPGTWVLVGGSGGLSVAALQLAVAAGATVVATTSSEEKEARLRTLGAAHTVNYLREPKEWAAKARDLTPSGRGFDIVVDVGGDETLLHSLSAVRLDGVVALVGLLGNKDAPSVPLVDVFQHGCIVRSLILGSREQLRQVVQFVDERKITPAIDDKVFELAETKDAYRFLSEKRHFAKVVIRIDH
ncbi:putative alcohol dehydrogenase [Chaetomium fimeti]|uniref:Alcohol dehydrogenase n=1 Tax=Chaetomium fimeti TaxID=1854472 RepID=A0AAE0H7T7_9PEZI|nr:putative alcohol dehydrogenase [Chaetomium fimeti]